MAFEKVLVYIVLPMTPLIAMSIGCLIEWLIKRR